MVSALTDFLVTVLNQLHLLTNNYGWSIVIFSVLVKMALYYPTQQQYRSMREMQSKQQLIQPEMKRIQEKYKDDPERLQKEMAELYQKHNFNPVGGCLPMLLQMPILYGIYGAVRKIFTIQPLGVSLVSGAMAAAGVHGTISGAHETFLWVGTPLAERFSSYLATSWDQSDLLLVLIYGATMFLSQKLTTTAPPADPSQAQTQQTMSTIMPLMFTWMMWSYHWPCALVFYWLMFNVLSMFQQVHILREKNMTPGRKLVEEPVVAETTSQKSRKQ